MVGRGLPKWQVQSAELAGSGVALRIDNLFGDTLFPLVSWNLGEYVRGRPYSRFSSAPSRSFQGDRYGMESLIGMRRKPAPVGLAVPDPLPEARQRMRE